MGIFQYISQMKYLMSLAICTLLFIGTPFLAIAQQDTTALAKIVAATQRFDNQFTPEKVYLHFDKPYYSVGDTIWFKGYVTGGQNQPSALSKILYVEVLNEADSLVQLLKLPVNNGSAPGNLFLDKDDFKHGNYYVRAYTLWMTNFDPDFFFYQAISIGETIDRNIRTNIHFTNNTDGKVDARILFKDSDGRPYAEKQVNWQIISSYDVVAKGRGTTDNNGVIHVIIPTDSKKTPLEKNSQLVTQLTNIEKEDVQVSSFSLKNIQLTNDIQFFPEGGEFIQGIPLQVGFKSIRSNGLGTDSKGKIKDEAGNVITEFSSKHMGMGSFYLNMDAGKKYFAHVTFKDGSTSVIPLPLGKASGIAIQATDKSADVIDIRVAASVDYLNAHKDQKVYLIAQNNGIVYFAAQGILQKQTFSARILKSKLPTGIIQLVLFSDKDEPLSERLVFVRNKGALILTVQSDKPSYGTKQKVVLSLKALDSVKVPVPLSNLSLSVVDETKVPMNENAETTILSTLLLTSDLKGYVEQPNYYFNKPNEVTTAALDYLMLTQGFRRFSYKELLANKFPHVVEFPEQGISITGTLRNKTGLPINKGALVLTIAEKRFNKQILTSPVGEFAFPNLVFNDGNTISLSAKYNPMPNNMMIMVNGMPEAALGSNKNAADYVVNIDSSMTNYLTNSAKQYQFMRTIKTVNITQKSKKANHSDFSVLSSLPMIADHTIPASQFGNCLNLADCLKMNLPGITMYDNNFYLTRDLNAGGQTPMSIYMNGLPIDVNGVNTISVNDLESVELFYADPLGTIDRQNNTRGVIVLNMKPIPKRTKMSAEELRKLIPQSYIVNYKPRGYSVTKEFYTPKYSVNPAELNFTDLRTTVYWNPAISTDEQGNASVGFFNADGRGSYRAVLEGTDSKGNVARTVFRYTVK